MDDTFETFFAYLKQEVIKRKLFNGIEANAKIWVKKMKREYYNHHELWSDRDRVFEKILAIREFLEDEIDVETITMESFMEQLKKSTNFYLKSVPWFLDAYEYTIRILLDAFKNSYHHNYY